MDCSCVTETETSRRGQPAGFLRIIGHLLVGTALGTFVTAVGLGVLVLGIQAVAVAVR